MVRVARLMVTGFTASTTTLKELENTLKLDETVVRFETFRCKDPLREFLNRKMDPEELLHEHLPAATATAAELEQELQADDDDSEEYENVGREFSGMIMKRWMRKLKSPSRIGDAIYCIRNHLKITTTNARGVQSVPSPTNYPYIQHRNMIYIADNKTLLIDIKSLSLVGVFR